MNCARVVSNYARLQTIYFIYIHLVIFIFIINYLITSLDIMKGLNPQNYPFTTAQK